MLFARLQLLAPEARIFLLAAADGTDTGAVAEALAASIERAGLAVRTVGLFGSTREGDKAQTWVLPAEARSNLTEVQKALGGFDGYTVAVGGNLLKHGPTLLATRSADGVLLTAARGKTSRTDLSRAKKEVERAGGQVLGVVLK